MTTKTVVYYCLLFVGLFVVAWQGFSWLKVQQDTETQRCQAGQQTILDEAELIVASGKFPSEQTTNRWKALLGGCND